MKKIISTFIAGIMVAIMPLTVFAEFPDNNINQADYQAVLDKINTEYGSNIHFPSQSELAEAGLVTRGRAATKTFSFTEEELRMFEEQLREIAITSAEESRQAEIEFAQIQAMSDAEKNLPNENPSISPRVTRTYIKQHMGSNCHLQANRTTLSGAYIIDHVYDFYITSILHREPKIGDVSLSLKRSNSWNYSLSNGGKKCTVKVTGIKWTYSIVGWIPSDITTNIAYTA